MAMFVLTEEGKNYLEKGLPERRLIELLKKVGRITLKEAEEQVENFDIALQWAKKKGFVELKFNELVLVKEPESFPEEEALKKIDAGEEVDEKILKILIQRNLVKKVVRGEVDKLIGKEVTNLSPELIKTGIWKKVKFKPYSITTPAQKLWFGKLHFYKEFLEEMKERLIGMGFVEARGPLVEMNFWNCDVLFMPSDHPSRSIHEVFFLKNPNTGKVLDKKLWERVRKTHEKGWGYWDPQLAKKLILRSHGTAISARTLYKLRKEDLPFKMFAIAKCFRPDVIDAKHHIEFEQCEGIVVEEGLNFRHLLWYLKEIASCVGVEKVRFKPTYFPFTEPSVELQGYVDGWIELGGAGIFRPEVTLPLGIEFPVLAWGIGIGRLAMAKLGIKDIRDLYSEKLEVLSKKFLV
jgi:phenylalanyl-tRNA synthetase alpha chain